MTYIGFEYIQICNSIEIRTVRSGSDSPGRFDKKPRRKQKSIPVQKKEEEEKEGRELKKEEEEKEKEKEKKSN